MQSSLGLVTRMTLPHNPPEGVEQPAVGAFAHTCPQRSAAVATDTNPPLGTGREPGRGTKSQNSLSARLRTAPTIGEPLAPCAFWAWITSTGGVPGGEGQALVAVLRQGVRKAGKPFVAGVPSKMMLSPSRRKI